MGAGIGAEQICRVGEWLEHWDLWVETQPTEALSGLDLIRDYKLGAVIPMEGTLTKGTTTPDFALVSSGIRGARIEVLDASRLGVWGSAHNMIRLEWREQRIQRTKREEVLDIPGVRVWNMRKKAERTSVRRLHRFKSLDEWEEDIRKDMGEPSGHPGSGYREEVIKEKVWSELRHTPWTEEGNKTRSEIMKRDTITRLYTVTRTAAETTKILSEWAYNQPLGTQSHIICQCKAVERPEGWNDILAEAHLRTQYHALRQGQEAEWYNSRAILEMLWLLRSEDHTVREGLQNGRRALLNLRKDG
ncbi:hypothetical protein J8273_5520 [Carpediemonas membranifera]|uniref:Uncharacterized protein n=1 Tax=Carpediemonas membranifera TaxID=201153 RepID=A0A8J6E110_9EUKA|nr:hypothetical protein J8273_5520 [Carpediemonas membranifera]|eukprot:KAG9392516.1 hypothetical protein J8273_5520 [Carpediemonas membranifera]